MNRLRFGEFSKSFIPAYSDCVVNEGWNTQYVCGLSPKNEREIAALDVVQKGASFFLFELLVDLNLYRKDKRKLRLSIIYQF